MDFCYDNAMSVFEWLVLSKKVFSSVIYDAPLLKYIPIPPN